MKNTGKRMMLCIRTQKTMIRRNISSKTRIDISSIKRRGGAILVDIMIGITVVILKIVDPIFQMTSKAMPLT